MIAALRRSPLMAGLAVASVVLAVLLAFEIGDASDWRPPAAPAKAASAATGKLLPSMQNAPAEQAYPETAARPLFVPTRRPVPVQTAAAKPSMNRGQFVLQGVIITSDTRVAMLREKASGKIRRAELGKEVNGLKVAAIEPESVTLTLGDEQEAVPLQVQKGTAVSAAPPTPGPFALGHQPAPPATPGAPGAPAAHPALPPPPAPPAPVPQSAYNLLGVTPPQAGAPAQPPAGQPATNAPLSPEELLARRRARRTQQNP